MDDGFTILDEGWRASLSTLVDALRSDALDGDAQRLRIKRELVQTLGQCKRVMAASDELRASMQRLYEFMDVRSRPHAGRDKRLVR